MRPSDRYLKIVEWSEEDNCYIGTCPGLFLGGIHGDNEIQVHRELCEAVEEWIEIHEADGEPLPEPTAGRAYSGKFVLRVGEDLHRELALRALREGTSLNSYCIRKLSGSKGPSSESDPEFPERAKRARGSSHPGKKIRIEDWEA